MAQLVLRPMRSRRHARGRRVWSSLLVALLVAFGLAQWFGGVYVRPPGDGSPGETTLVWRAAQEPFFNSPAVPGFARGPAGRVLTGRLPFWSYAYRRSLEAATRAAPVAVGAPSPSSSPADVPAAVTLKVAATPNPAPSVAAPSAASRPKVAATPAHAPRVAATPAPQAPVAPHSTKAERDRQLDRIRQEMERIRREATPRSSAESRPTGSGG